VKKTLTAKNVFENPVSGNKFAAGKTSRKSNGTYALAKLEINPGDGKRLHTHRTFTKSFLSVKDKLGVRINNEEYKLAPGQSMKLPLNTNHQFLNLSHQPMTLYIKFEPGHDKFIKMVLGALFPVFRRLPSGARKNAIEEKLPDRYFYE